MGYLLNAVYGCLLLFTLPFWLFKAATTGKYRAGLAERFWGAVPPTSGNPVVWFHAVSVGEVLLLRPLLEQLQQQRPDLELVISTTTNTGYAVAREKYPQLTLFYFPLDFTWAVSRVLDALNPVLLVLTELELWPNLLLEAKKLHVPVTVINARLGERSFRGYMKIQRVLRGALEAIDWWGAQDAVYAERLRQLVPEADIDVTGSMKYDGAAADRHNPKTQQLGRILGCNPYSLLWVAGSTMWPEEKIVLNVFLRLQSKYPGLRLAIVPRHRERFDSVADFLQKRQIHFQRRSQIGSGDCTASVLLVDTVGELSSLWGLADFGYVGGSMNCGRGGQSMIEPAAYGVPICFGPDTKNFRSTVECLLAEQAAVVVESEDELFHTIQNWLQDPEQAAAMGQRAQQFIASQQGAVAATLRGLLKFLPTAPPLARSA